MPLIGAASSARPIRAGCRTSICNLHRSPRRERIRPCGKLQRNACFRPGTVAQSQSRPIRLGTKSLAPFKSTRERAMPTFGHREDRLCSSGISYRRNGGLWQSLPAALSACAAQLPALSTGALSGLNVAVAAPPLEVYQLIARHASRCWFAPDGRLRAKYIFHARVPSPAEGGNIQIALYNRMSNPKKPWGTKGVDH